MPEQPPSPLALALTFLRSSAGWSMARLASALGLVDKSQIAAYERGAKALTREQLESTLAPIGCPSEAVDVVLFAHGLIHPEPPEQDSSPVALTPDEWRIVERAAMAAGWTAARAAADIVRTERIREWKERKKAEEREKAEELFQGLLSLTHRERPVAIEALPALWSWALAVRLCEASLKSAAHRAEEALELAELAVAVAQRVPGEKSWRSRLAGFCWAHVANARRVANDFAGADKAFAQAWALWRKGAASDAGLLDEWLLPALEASWRREQRRFPEALELIKQARAGRGGSNPNALLTLLLKEESIFNQMGEPRRALEALAEAVPLCEASGDCQMLFALRFNMADDLCQLERFGEAAELLAQVRELALQQGHELDLIRVDWLVARIAAGQGQTAEALAGLQRVRQDFTARELAYDAALSSLDLAVLLLKAGRTAEVRKLAVAMGWIFTAKGIDREALAALKLFCGAARQEAATVELAQRVIAEIEQARRSAPSQARGRG